MPFSPETCEAIGHYVYRLIDPRDNQTFYVGKGSNNRAFDHAQIAVENLDEENDKLARIRSIIAAGFEPTIKIHRHQITDQLVNGWTAEDVALEIEAALIDAYEELTNMVSGRDSGVRGVALAEDVEANYRAQDAQIDVPCVLIKINRLWRRNMNAQELRSVTSKAWVCRPDLHPQVQRALAVSGGIVRAGYTIRGWNPAHVGNNGEALNGNRIEFQLEDAEGLQQLVGQSVRHLYEPGASNPIRWFDEPPHGHMNG